MMPTPVAIPITLKNIADFTVLDIAVIAMIFPKQQPAMILMLSNIWTRFLNDYLDRCEMHNTVVSS
jgi:hypothetical protein